MYSVITTAGWLNHIPSLFPFCMLSYRQKMGGTGGEGKREGIYGTAIPLTWDPGRTIFGPGLPPLPPLLPSLRDSPGPEMLET